MTSDSEERQSTSTAFTSTHPEVVNKARDVKDISVLRKKKAKKQQIHVLLESFKDIVSASVEEYYKREYFESIDIITGECLVC